MQVTPRPWDGLIPANAAGKMTQGTASLRDPVACVKGRRLPFVLQNANIRAIGQIRKKLCTSARATANAIQNGLSVVAVPQELTAGIPKRRDPQGEIYHAHQNEHLGVILEVDNHGVRASP